jgi:AcrR family transcriptional regulator
MTSANQADLDAQKAARRMPREERRRQLVSAALDVFLANGYQATAMDDIAAHAGVSKALLYQHFPGKLELYLEVLRAHLDELISRVRDTVDLSVDNKGRLDAVIRVCFDWVLTSKDTVGLAFKSPSIRESHAGELIDQAWQSAWDMIAEIVTDDTFIDRELVSLLAASLVGAVESAALAWICNEHIASRSTVERMISSFAWSGISGLLSEPVDSVPRDDSSHARGRELMKSGLTR